MPALARLAHLGLRAAQFVFAAVVLGLVSHFIHVHHTQHVGPLGREIYVLIVAVLALIISLFTMLPRLHSIMHILPDTIMMLAWFAAFGVLVNWLHHSGCGSYFTWGNLTHGSECDKWQAAEAFSFLSAIVWLASWLLALWLRRRERAGITTTGRNTTTV